MKRKRRKRKSRFPTGRMALNDPRFQERKMSEESQRKTFCTQEVELQFSPNNESATQKMWFFELLGQETIQKIRAHTIVEALRKDDKNFDVSTEELCAFLGLCLIRGVPKGKKSATFCHGFCNFKFTQGYSPLR